MTDPSTGSGHGFPTGTVTFLFTDIEGSTKLAQTHPAAWPAAQARHHAILQSAIESHGGYVFQIIGDAFCAAFATAPDALAAALAAQRAMHTEDWGETPIRVRMGMHSGAATLRSDGNYEGYLAMATVQRVMALAYGGQTLVSNAAAGLLAGKLSDTVSLRDLGEHRLKGLRNPEHLWQVLAPDLPKGFPPLPSLNTVPNNLPVQLTSFVGREKELVELKRLLPTTRLLTLTGSGGVGKTRLALQVAAETLDTFKDGVWFIELAPLADPALIPSTIASTMGLREQPDQPILDLLLDLFRARTALLILDNCEHLIAECARVVDNLLHAAPKLIIITSSREALGIAGETAYRVPSLECPPLAQALLMPLEALMQYEAVRLFIERAKQALPALPMIDAYAPAIAQICVRLDGIPLAIELAAVRVKLLSLEQIAARLDDRFRMLTGGSRTALPRQQTLRATVDWSYSLLSEAERALLRRLAVFAGSWSLDAAQTVCAGERIGDFEFLDLLARLVDKSLVVVENRSASARYRMLETIRQYAREKLLDSGEVTGMRSRHLRYFLEMAAKADVGSPGSSKWLSPLNDEYDNLLAALAWAEESSEYELGLELITVLGLFWYSRGHTRPARDHFTNLLALTSLERPGDSEQQAASKRLKLRAQAFNTLGMLNWYWGDPLAALTNFEQSVAAARELGLPGLSLQVSPLSWLALATIGRDIQLAQSLADEALAIARELGPQHELAEALNMQGQVALNRGMFAPAINYFKECYELNCSLGYELFTGRPLSNLGFVYYLQGNYSDALSCYERALAIWREVGDKRSACTALRAIGDVLRLEGDYAAAEVRYEESLAMRQELGSIRPIATALESLGRVARLQNDYGKAVALLTESLMLRREANHPRDTALSIEAFADLAAAQGRPERAVQLFGAAANLLGQAHARIDPADGAEHDRALASLRAQLNPAVFDAAWDEGRQLTLDQAVALALENITD